ncbi:ATP-binding domain-containing protein [Xanthomonas hydrangeae]|uniref:ATP-binding domain-containing protein n=1 Tax=Xanthomonas hydrangeae TaxID=2775159 RepID=A0AAU0BF67_9XANT|nr:ATP-binding domain-containing protein [Xanthomonas hydrangeae]WOB50718.1 ATP-binding domain-containing protein [Xanthomonas hydrangeae]
MSDYCFYAPDAQDLVERAGLGAHIEEFATRHKKQTYVLRKPLSKDDATYEYDHAVIIFSAGMHPCFIDLKHDQEALEEYADDVFEDISFLSEKFRYREKIGRKKSWSPLFHYRNSDNVDLHELIIEKPTDARVVDLITSLVVGSINDISRINLEARDLLEVVKSKIILFDTDQTSFVFRSGGSKRLSIQGLAGSGKTELLLHKIKEIYSRDSEARIAFTCFNKILASSMRRRIPDFFDFMRVERQIEWNKKLFCFHSWGSGKEPLSGMYRYICHTYGIPFGSLSAGPFDSLCKQAIVDIKAANSDNKKIFDYVFIDESQDFGSSFLELCELVTAKKIFVAGDVFQNIFRPIDDRVHRADMVLKKCYRTDPTNLMFSHSLGMGLFEHPVLRWLKPDEWDACGYDYRGLGERAYLSRDPLRRFEDIPSGFRSTEIHQLPRNATISLEILGLIDQIRERHPTTEEGDIAVIFLDKDSYIYDVISELKVHVFRKFGWDPNVSFETKETDPTRFFISNVNNAKGLEFPFVICVARDLNRHPSFRNALYTMMARSFLESHLVITSFADPVTVESLKRGLNSLYDNGYLDVRIPTENEMAQQKDFLVLEEQASIEDIVRRFCVGRNASPRLIGKLTSRMNMILAESDYDEDYVNSLLEVEYSRHRQL